MTEMDKRIPVDEATRDRLRAEKQGAETYSDVINRLLDSREAIQEKPEEWRERTQDMMDDIDTESSHYTGNAGSLCMGLQLAADEVEELLND